MMDTKPDLYQQLSVILGKTVTPDATLELSDEEWDALPESSKNAISELLDLAMRFPSYVFPEGTAARRAAPADLPDPQLPSWAELMRQEREAEEANTSAPQPASLPEVSGHGRGGILGLMNAEEINPNLLVEAFRATFFDVPGIKTMNLGAAI